MLSEILKPIALILSLMLLPACVVCERIITDCPLPLYPPDAVLSDFLLYKDGTAEGEYVKDLVGQQDVLQCIIEPGNRVCEKRP